MNDFLPFVVVGLVTGAVYALASMGLVLTYTTSGVFNFAHGAVGMFATYVFYSLRVEAGLPTPVAVAVAVLGVAPLMGILVDRMLLRRLDGAPAATYVVASLGLLVALQGLAVAIYGGGTRSVAALFPKDTYRLPGVNVGIDQTVVVVVAVAAGIGLAFFFRRTHLGLQTRAVVGDRDLTELVGTNARLVTTGSWMLGGSFAGAVRGAVLTVHPAGLAAAHPPRRAGLRGGDRRPAPQPATHQSRCLRHRRGRRPVHQARGHAAEPGRPPLRLAVHRPVRGARRQSQGTLRRSHQGPRRVVRAPGAPPAWDAGARRGRRVGGRRGPARGAQRQPVADRHQHGGLRARLHQPLAARRAVPPGLVVSRRVRGLRRDDALPPALGRRSLPHRPSPGRPGDGARRRVAGHPGDPAVRAVPGPGHLRFRHPRPEPAVSHRRRLRTGRGGLGAPAGAVRERYRLLLPHPGGGGDRGGGRRGRTPDPARPALTGSG